MNKQSGFTYFEILVAVVILSFVLIPMLGQFYIGFVGNKASVAVSQAVFLAEDLMDEIISKRFDENLSPNPPTNPNLLGTDSGENPNDRRTFDDVDDYKGWQKSPPQKLDGTLLNDFSGFTQSANVKYVTLNAQNYWVDAASATNYKQINVTISGNNIGDIVLTTLMAYE